MGTINGHVQHHAVLGTHCVSKLDHTLVWDDQKVHDSPSTSIDKIQVL